MVIALQRGRTRRPESGRKPETVSRVLESSFGRFLGACSRSDYGSRR